VNGEIPARPSIPSHPYLSPLSGYKPFTFC